MRLALTDKPKRQKRRKRVWPEPIPDDPNNVLKAILNSPPRKREDWRYLREYEEPR